MSTYQVVAPAQLSTATTSTGTSTFSNCTTNVFQIDNTNATIFAYVNVFTTNNPSANGFTNPIAGGRSGTSLIIPPNQGRILVGNFAVTGGGQNVYVNHITNSASAVIAITPIAAQRDVTI